MRTQNRIAKGEFRDKMRGATRVNTPHFTLLVKRGTAADAPTQVGFVTPARVLGNAVNRNANRRRLREAADRLIAVRDGISVVVMVRSDVSTLDARNVAQEMLDGIQRATRRWA